MGQGAFIRSMRPSVRGRTRRRRIAALLTLAALAGIGWAAERFVYPLYLAHLRARDERTAVRILRAVDAAERAFHGHAGHYTASLVELAGLTSKLAVERPEVYAVLPTGGDNGLYRFEVALDAQGYVARATPAGASPPWRHLTLRGGEVHVAEGRPAEATDPALPRP